MSKTRTPAQWLAYAQFLIDRKSNDWYDFCSNCGMIPDNIAHVRGVRESFAEYLQENG